MKLYFVWVPEYGDILKEENCSLMLNFSTAPKARLGKAISLPNGFDDVIVDSGGFQLQSGVKTNRVVSAKNYANWLYHAVQEIPNLKYMNLDLRGDEEQTLKNLAYLEESGFHPIPVWHGSLWDVNNYYLDYYTSEYKYIALGDIAGTSRSRQKIANIANFVHQNYPNNDFHLLGVGVGASVICQMLNPYSIDFSTWANVRLFGHEIVRVGSNVKEQKMTAEESERVRHDKEFGRYKIRQGIRALKEFEAIINNQTAEDKSRQIMMM